MKIKLKLNTFLFLFLLSNVVSTLGMIISAILPISMVVNLLMILYGTVYLIYQKETIRKKNTIFYLYCFWSLMMIVTGLSLDVRVIGRFFSNPESAFFLLFPMFIYRPIGTEFFKVLLKYLVIFNIIYLIFLIIAYRQIFLDLNFYEFVSKRFAYGNTFLLLLFGFLTPKRKALSVLIFIITLLLALILARRAQIFYLGLSGFFAFTIYIFYFKRKYLLMATISTLLILTIGLLFNSSQLFETHFSKLANRIDEDTRSVVEKDLLSDISPLEFIIGKGINGKFKTSVLVDVDYDGDTRSSDEKNYRYGIETGYLNTILKGGIVKLLLDLLIIGFAIFKALVYGKNIITKVAASFLLIYVATLYPENANAFNLRYLLVWICVSICLNSAIRRLNNSQIFDQYLYNGK